MERCEQRRMLAGDGVIDGLIVLFDAGYDSAGGDLTVGGQFTQIEAGVATNFSIYNGSHDLHSTFTWNLDSLNWNLDADDDSGDGLLAQSPQGESFIITHSTDGRGRVYVPVPGGHIDTSPFARWAVTNGWEIDNVDGVLRVGGDTAGYDPPLRIAKIPEPTPPEFPTNGGSNESATGLVQVAAVFDLPPATSITAQSDPQSGQPREVQLAGYGTFDNSAVLDRALAFEVPGPVAAPRDLPASPGAESGERQDQDSEESSARFFQTALSEKQPASAPLNSLAGPHFNTDFYKNIAAHDGDLIASREENVSLQTIARDEVLCQWDFPAGSDAHLLEDELAQSHASDETDLAQRVEWNGKLVLERSGEAVPWLAVLATHRALSRKRDEPLAEEPRRMVAK